MAKGDVAIILGKLKKKGRHDEEERRDETGLEACAEDLMDAVSAKDPARVASALRDAFAILQAEEADPEPEDYEG